MQVMSMRPLVDISCGMLWYRYTLSSGLASASSFMVLPACKSFSFPMPLSCNSMDQRFSCLRHQRHFLTFIGTYHDFGIHHYLCWQTRRWLDKIGMTGGYLQILNGVALLTTFFLVRGLWGWFMAYSLFSKLWYARDDINWILTGIYLFSNMSLNALNIYWFSKMIAALRKRVSPIASAPTKEKKLQ